MKCCSDVAVKDGRSHRGFKDPCRVDFSTDVSNKKEKQTNTSLQHKCVLKEFSYNLFFSSCESVNNFNSRLLIETNPGST